MSTGLTESGKSGRHSRGTPDTFKLIVNLKTAKALGITMPESIVLRADEVIR